MDNGGAACSHAAPASATAPFLRASHSGHGGVVTPLPCRSPLFLTMQVSISGPRRHTAVAHATLALCALLGTTGVLAQNTDNSDPNSPTLKRGAKTQDEWMR